MKIRLVMLYEEAGVVTGMRHMEELNGGWESDVLA